jgi:hypothetical protein
MGITKFIKYVQEEPGKKESKDGLYIDLGLGKVYAKKKPN